jgi:hypothetical protein
LILYLEEEGSAEVRALVEEAEVHAALARGRGRADQVPRTEVRGFRRRTFYEA